MPAVVQKVGNVGQWNVTVKLYEADGTTLATVYKDPNGDATGGNPLPKQRAVGDFGVDTAGNWTAYLPAGDYQVGVRPSGGAETKTAFTLTATPDADVGYELTAVFGVRADGDVPVWNDADQRLEWGAAGGTGIVQSVVAGANVTVDATDPANPVVASSGGSSSVTRVSIPFSFDTVGILVADTKGGIPVYTPAVGDILLNAIVSVPAATQFDGDYNLFMDTSSAVAAGLSALSLNNGLAGNADTSNGSGTLFSILEDMVITWASDKAQLFTTTDALLMCLGNGITPPTQGAGVVTLVILSAS